MTLSGETGRARLRIPHSDADGPRHDAVIEAIRAEHGADLAILGEIGRTLNGQISLLARDSRRKTVVALLLTPVAERSDQYDLEVARELEDETARCPRCGAQIRSTGGRFCTRCGADVSALREKWSATELRAAVQERASERGYEIRDEIRIPGGRVYFAARNSGAIEALQVDETHNGDFALGVTGMLRQLFAEITAPRMR